MHHKQNGVYATFFNQEIYLLVTSECNPLNIVIVILNIVICNGKWGKYQKHVAHSTPVLELSVEAEEVSHRSENLMGPH